MPLQRSMICKGCWQQMGVPVPLRGVLSIPFRAFGIRPSRMNPNTCTVCELMFTRVMRARKVTINATVLFADLRGYTSLSESLSPDQIAGLLDTFYDECADAIWEYDGLLNKTIGDAVMAVFNFPIQQDDHAPIGPCWPPVKSKAAAARRGSSYRGSASAQPTSVWVSACIRANSASASLASPIATSRPSVPL